MNLFNWIELGVILLLAGLFYFKSAINEVIVTWYRNHEEKRRKEREDLRETYNCLNKMFGELRMILIMYPIINYSKPPETAFYINIYQVPAMERFGKLQDSLNKVRIRLPKDTRKIVDEAYAEMIKKMEEAQLDSNFSFKKLLGIIDPLTKKIAHNLEELTNYIDS